MRGGGEGVFGKNIFLAGIEGDNCLRNKLLRAAGFLNNLGDS